jgi:hypothetical protein
MTPKEKAIELIEKYRDVSISFVDSIEGTCDMRMNNEDAKECALIAVDEFIEYLRWTQDYHLANYLREVKQEIEKL